MRKYPPLNVGILAHNTTTFDLRSALITIDILMFATSWWLHLCTSSASQSVWIIHYTLLSNLAQFQNVFRHWIGQ